MNQYHTVEYLECYFDSSLSCESMTKKALKKVKHLD